MLPTRNVRRTLLRPVSTGGQIFTLLALLMMVWVASPAAFGQDEPADDATPAATAPDTPAADDAAGEQISLLQWAAASLGWFYGLTFLGISFTLVALFVMNVLTARRENVVPTELISGFEQQLNSKQYQEAYDLAKGDESFFGPRAFGRVG